jgi:thiamine kinase-like enzyme
MNQPERRIHQQEVHRFLQKSFSIRDWTFTLPPGSGMETYFVHGDQQSYFVKVGVATERYLVMAESGLTPPVVAFGQLESDSSIIVQSYVAGRTPSRTDFQHEWQRVAALVSTMHHDPRLISILRSSSSNSHKESGLRAMNRLRQKWERSQTHVPEVAPFVDKSLDELERQIHRFSTEGLVASHNDICNANWLFASNGKIYVVDFESMSMDDPAFDLGALLWWYYPPRLRQPFLETAGYLYDLEFRLRMQVRMALHCLSITLPREGSFDRFDSGRYAEALTDFRAILEGRENPQGDMA